MIGTYGAISIQTEHFQTVHFQTRHESVEAEVPNHDCLFEVHYVVVMQWLVWYIKTRKLSHHDILDHAMIPDTMLCNNTLQHA